VQDTVHYYKFYVPSEGTITITYDSGTANDIGFYAGTGGCESSNIIYAPSSTGGTATINVRGDSTIDIKVFGVIDGTSSVYDFTITYTSTLACQSAPDFFTIDGSEQNLTGKSTLGSEGIANDGTFYKFEATGTGGDINGTLKITTFSTNFNLISAIQILDENCNVISSAYNLDEFVASMFIDHPGTWYLRLSDDNNYNPLVVTSMVWYPDVNGTGGSGSVYTPSYNEPAIFKGSDVGTGPLGPVTTKVVNREHNISIYVVKDDGDIYEGFKGSFMLELIDHSDYANTGCKAAPALKYDGILGLNNTDRGEMQTGDESTAHGPALSYDRAVRDAAYRMTYLVDPTSGGVITYEELIETNGCVGNTQDCLWGVLTSLASTKRDPYLPDFTIADVCGAYCQPGVGGGNLQVSPECAACVFGQFGYSDCSDNFAIRPDHYEIDSTENSYPDLLRAGTGYELNITAKDAVGGSTLGYNQAGGNLDVSNTKKFLPDGTDGTAVLAGSAALGTGFNFVNGAPVPATGATYQYSDVGKIAIHIEDQEWAAVDLDDTPQTCDDNGAFVCGDKNATFIPHHFGVTVKDLHNNSAGDKFTYLSSDANKTVMGARFDVEITAENEQYAKTENFDKDYYENPVTIKLDLPTYAGLDPSVKHQIDTAQLIGFVDGNKTIEWNDTNDSLILSFNYPRKTNEPVNPFIVYGDKARADVNSTYTGTAPEGTAYIDGSDDAGSGDQITFVYGRTHMARTRAMCNGGNCTGNVTFFYEFYGDQDANATLINTILTNPQRSIDSVNWYRNSEHNTSADGNVTSIVSTIPGSGTPIITPYPTNSSAAVNYNGTQGYPYKSTLKIYTQSWLVYDPFNVIDPANAAQQLVTGQLEYYGPGSWSSNIGAETSVKDDGTNRNQNSNRRIRW